MKNYATKVVRKNHRWVNQANQLMNIRKAYPTCGQALCMCIPRSRANFDVHRQFQMALPFFPPSGNWQYSLLECCSGAGRFHRIVLQPLHIGTRPQCNRVGRQERTNPGTGTYRSHAAMLGQPRVRILERVGNCQRLTSFPTKEPQEKDYNSGQISCQPKKLGENQRIIHQ
jgi:hypothetical protein